MFFFDSTTRSFRLQAQKRFVFPVFCFLMTFFVLALSSCINSGDRMQDPASVQEPVRIGFYHNTAVTEADKELEVGFGGLFGIEPLILKDKELDHYIFYLQGNRLLYWGEKSNGLFSEYSISWRCLKTNRKNKTSRGDIEEIACSFTVPKSDGSSMVFLFSRGKSPESGDYYFPDETTEYAYRIFSKEELDDLVRLGFWNKKEYISYNDLKLEFKSEEEMVRDDLLFLLVAMAFSEPSYTLYSPDIMPYFSNELYTYNTSCKEYVDRLNILRKRIGRKTFDRDMLDDSDFGIHRNALRQSDEEQ